MGGGARGRRTIQREGSLLVGWRMLSGTLPFKRIPPPLMGCLSGAPVAAWAERGLAPERLAPVVGLSQLPADGLQCGSTRPGDAGSSLDRSESFGGNRSLLERPSAHSLIFSAISCRPTLCLAWEHEQGGGHSGPGRPGGAVTCQELWWGTGGSPAGLGGRGQVRNLQVTLAPSSCSSCSFSGVWWGWGGGGDGSVWTASFGLQLGKGWGARSPRQLEGPRLNPRPIGLVCPQLNLFF